MAFDLAWGYRGTLAYVTDPAYQCFDAFGSVYPHTYSNSNGDSINAGWNSNRSGGYNRAATNDPRIAGMAYESNGTTWWTFTVDLSSGSAPGAGDYTVDCALGDPLNAQRQVFKLLDNTTVLIDGTNGGAGINTTGGQFVDATLALVSATTTWTGATASKTFATTTAIMEICGAAAGGASALAHFRLTKQEAAAYVLVCTPRPTPT